jgi:hypothetical protein
MQAMKSGALRALLAAAVMAMVVMPVAIANGQGPSATVSATSTAAKIKALTKQARKLNQLAASLAQRIAALEGKGDVRVPAALPPSGPAGGDLTGSYPKPQLSANSVNSAKVADSTIGTPDLANSAITFNKIAPGAVQESSLAEHSIGGVRLKTVFTVENTVEVKGGSPAVETTARCPGNSVTLSGGYDWTSAVGDVRVLRSHRVGDGWNVRGEKIGSGDTILIAEAACLSE